MIISLFPSAELSTWLEHLVAASIKGVLVLIIAAGLCLVLRRASAASRHLVWSLALAGLVALPLLSLELPAWQIVVLPTRPTEISATVANDALEPAAYTKMMSPSQSEESARSRAGEQSAGGEAQSLAEKKNDVTANRGASMATAAQIDWARWALIIWLAGVLLILARLLAGTASVWWTRRRASAIADSNWMNLASDLTAHLGLTRRAALLRTRRITMPITCGLLRPAVLLPADSDEWSDERRQVVLLHELAHVERWDCLTQMLSQIACAIYWFNPLVWMAARLLRIERERACDDQVLDAGTKASDYANHLLDIARSFRSAKCSSLGAVAIARRSQLEGRLLAILDPGLRRQRLSRIGSLAVGVLIACVVLPLSALRLSAHAQARPGPAVSAIPALPNQTSAPDPSPLPASPPQSAAEYERQRLEQTTQSQPGAVDAAQPEQGEQHETQKSAPSPNSANQKDNSAVIEALREALKDEDAEVRQHALFALTQIGDQQAGAALVQALKDESWQVRARAAYGLGLRAGRNEVDALVGALKDASWQVREQAAWGLGLRGDARAIEPLINALRDEASDVREKAAWALGLRGDKRSVEPLMAALKDNTSSVRGMAAWALGLKGDQRAANALKDALKDPDKGVRQRAAWALGMLLMRRGEAVGGNMELDVDADPDVEFDLKGKADIGVGGVHGSIPGGVPGGVSGRIPGGVPGGIGIGVGKGVPRGVGPGVIGVPGGVGSGVGSGVSGAVGTGGNRKLTKSNSSRKTKAKPKQE